MLAKKRRYWGLGRVRLLDLIKYYMRAKLQRLELEIWEGTLVKVFCISQYSIKHETYNWIKEIEQELEYVFKSFWLRIRYVHGSWEWEWSMYKVIRFLLAMLTQSQDHSGEWWELN